MVPNESLQRPLYPPSLGSGDTVALLATSHAAPSEAIRIATNRLRSFDLNVEVFETAQRDSAWLRNHPRARAEDFHQAFRDDTISGAIAVMGGNTGFQLLPYLDRELLRENPTRFFGGSDNTHLHLACTAAGVVSFHGGQVFPDLAVDSEMHPYTAEQIEHAFFDTPYGDLYPARSWTDEYYDLETSTEREWFSVSGWHWQGRGDADGRVIGGCFEMLETQLMMENGLFPEVLHQGDVLALETSGEVPDPAEIERFLGVLGEQGVLGRLGGVIVGKPETPGGSLKERDTYRQEQRKQIHQSISKYNEGIPIVFDLDFGHAAPVLPLPLGSRIRIDSEKQTVKFSEWSSISDHKNRLGTC